VITLLPATVTFTGTLSTRCGMGTADVMITGGTPPYTVTPIGGLAVSPTTVGASGGVFSVTAPLAAAPCSTNTSVVVTDSRGSITTLTVTIAAGSATAPALAVAPATIASLACGTSSPVTVIGGAGPLSATSSHPRITATLSGTTLTVTRLSPDPLPLGSYPGTATVTVTDGTTISTITVTATPTGGC
jgi:hypothetical protein